MILKPRGENGDGDETVHLKVGLDADLDIGMSRSDSTVASVA